MNDPALLHAALAALAPPKRFELLRLVLAGEAPSVSVLAGRVGLSQSCTTRHLQALERAGFVQGLRQGKRVEFRAASRGPAVPLLQALLQGAETMPAPLVPPAPRAPRASRRARGSRLRSGAALLEDVSPAFVASDGETHSDLAPTPAAPVAARQSDAESGKNSPPTSPAPRRSGDLEDFLL